MDEAKWYLRTQDETFGPETREKLIEWAKLGRVQPGQEISDDNVIWKKVEEVGFLDMRFSIDIGDGNPRGPFHRAAAEALLASGRLPQTATMVETRAPFEEKACVECAELAGADAGREVAPRTQVVEKVVERVVVDETRVKELEGLLAEERRHAADLQKRVDDGISEMTQLKAQLADRDEALQRKDALVAERETTLAERDAALARAETALREKDAQLAERDAALKQKESQLVSRDAMLVEKDALLAERDASLTQKGAALADRDALLTQREAELAAREVALKDAEARSEKLSEQVVALEDELKRLPAAASEVADIQAAVFKIMQDEAAAIEAALEREKNEFEECRKRHQTREEHLVECRREILKMGGRDIEEMTRKALVERPEDPRTACLRKDYEELRRVHEKALFDSEAKIRALSEQIHENRAEALRKDESLRDVTQLRAETEMLRERLQRAEKDLTEERQRSEELRQREALGKQTLMARLAALESPSIGTTATVETNQSREARQVKLPSWMRLKRP